MIKNIVKAGAFAVVAAFVVAPSAFAATVTKVVTPDALQTWQLNRDTSTTSPYEFVDGVASTGSGSLYVAPISDSNPKNKFIAELPLNTPAANLQNVSYDFKIDGATASVEDASQFYLNIYTKAPDSTRWHDCRYDYVPTVGSTAAFTTASFGATTVPTDVRAGAGVTCATTLAELPADWIVSQIALNVGDATVSDTGVAGYVDNVVVTTTAGATAYDFEKNAPPKTPTNKDQCKDNGWKTLVDIDGKAFKNQGQCVSSVAKTQGEVKKAEKNESLMDKIRGLLQ